MKHHLIVSLILIFTFSVNAQEVSFAPGVSFTGAPSYVSEFQEPFRDNGGPLSPFGSHVGLKAEVREQRFAGIEHFAGMTGKNILDYSRTGRFAVSSIGFTVDGERVELAGSRQIRFEWFGWEEAAKFEGFTARARVQFLGLDHYLISVKLTNLEDRDLKVSTALRLERRGRTFKVVTADGPEPVLVKFSVKPTVTPGENYLAILSSAAMAVADKGRDGFELRGGELRLSPGAEVSLWFIMAYSPDDSKAALSLIDSAKKSFISPDQAWRQMLAFREDFFNSLPRPHLQPEEKDYLELYRMAAVALENSLYAPRGAMKHWACVPTKVHYNWFWLWDSGFQALGYSEFRPMQSRDVILTMFDAQRKNGFIAHMTDERGKSLTPHSQPPVFGYSAYRMIARRPGDPEFHEFKTELYEKSPPFLEWWEKKRDVNHNGLFEYLSQDEGGWDNSPRMKYVPSMMFINYYGSLGELIGAKLKPLDNTDLNAWMYSYYRAMSAWALDLGKPEEAQAWLNKALALAGKVDEILWDEETGAWLDTYARLGSKDYRHFRVLTPHIWFPAFTGATRDEKKAREVIERHLLNPEEFFGRYPIPVVAYNDPYFDVTTNGWTAHIWLVTAYSALEALSRFGYEAEAQELRERLLSMMADQDGMKGIYETYDPTTGRYKGPHSTGGYASSQFGWSAAFTMEMILERYQEERFVFADTTAIHGHLRRAEDFYTREIFMEVEAGLDTPELLLESADGQPLLKARKFRVQLNDPYLALDRSEFRVRIRGKAFFVKLGEEAVIEIE